MLYNNTQKHDNIESTTIELQRDKNTEDSGISEGDSDSIGKPVNEPKTNSAIKKPNKSQKTKTHKNNSAGESSRELKVKEGYVLVEKTCYEDGKKLDEIHLKNTRNTSEELKKCKEECDDLLNTAADLKNKTDSAKKATKLVTTSINNHEQLLKNNNSKSKCITDMSIGGGAITMACGTFAALAFNPTFGIFGILGGVAFLYGLARKVSSCHGHLYKKPNSAVESIDIEKGMHKNCKELFTSIT
ncbi:hypothetical protein [Candidatus Mesenet endosymbiont of Phosphuga atrata]|uniref:hypothetical protein n=1 Tax=Candidatus Mesenet endosymbiont of Phosphuga atrata TaxID=3066221 RepID=UPI0030CC46F4